jgi:hypothetical protein
MTKPRVLISNDDGEKPHLIAAPDCRQPPIHRWPCGRDRTSLNSGTHRSARGLWWRQPRCRAAAAAAGGSCRQHALAATQTSLPLLAGITAPGLRALAAAIQRDGFCTFSVSAPAGERSAQSHCISIGKHLHAWELPVEGAEEACAVDGTPGEAQRLLSAPPGQPPGPAGSCSTPLDSAAR